MNLIAPDGSIDFIMENQHDCVLRVYLRLLIKAQAKGTNSCQISAAELSRSCGISVPSAIKGLKRLRELGFIETRQYRNPNKPCEHTIKNLSFSETKTTEVALIANPPFPRQNVKPFATDHDKYKAWLGTVTPEILNQIKAIYGKSINQYHMRRYFDEYVLPLETELA